MIFIDFSHQPTNHPYAYTKACNVMFYEENYNKYGAGGREPFVRDTYALRNFHREINCSAYIFQQRKHKFAPFLRIGGMEIGKTDYSFSAPTPKRNNESVSGSVYECVCGA